MAAFSTSATPIETPCIGGSTDVCIQVNGLLNDDYALVPTGHADAQHASALLFTCGIGTARFPMVDFHAGSTASNGVPKDYSLNACQEAGGFRVQDGSEVEFQLIDKSIASANDLVEVKIHEATLKALVLGAGVSGQDFFSVDLREEWITEPNGTPGGAGIYWMEAVCNDVTELNQNHDDCQVTP